MSSSSSIEPTVQPPHLTSGESAGRRLSPTAKLVRNRLVASVVLLFVVSTLSFVLLALTPGDPARAIVGLNASKRSYELVREELHLDDPIYTQYWSWLKNAVQGDFGTSIVTEESVLSSIEARLPTTLSLVIGAISVSVLIGTLLGTLSAVKGGSFAKVVDTLSLGAFALPEFWLAAILIAVFAVDLSWFPATGYVEFVQSPSGWLSSLVLPVTALSLAGIAMIAKQTREAMLDSLASEHIRVAWATGISPTSIVFRHAFRGAAISVLTVAALLFIGLLGGSVLVEAVFALPGVGSLAVAAASRHDLLMIQGVVVCFTCFIVVVNLIVDLLYLWLDPRVRLK
jgi:peptide/nickel transport system permease protein